MWFFAHALNTKQRWMKRLEGKRGVKVGLRKAALSIKEWKAVQSFPSGWTGLGRGRGVAQVKFRVSETLKLNLTLPNLNHTRSNPDPSSVGIAKDPGAFATRWLSPINAAYSFHHHHHHHGSLSWPLNCLLSICPPVDLL